MKKCLIALLCFVCVLAIAIPLWVAALPVTSYSATLPDDRFNSAAHHPTYSHATELYGYPGRFTVGYFPSSSTPADYAVYYGFLANDSDALVALDAMDEADHFARGGMYLYGEPRGDFMRVASGYATAIQYTVPYSGVINLDINGSANGITLREVDPVSGQYVQYAVFKNGTALRDWTTVGGQTTVSVSEINNLSVTAGDTITFAVRKYGSYASGVVRILPRIYYASTANEIFSYSAMAGTENGVFYPAVGTTYNDKNSNTVVNALSMPYDSSASLYRNSASEGSAFSANSVTVTPAQDSILLFRSPLIAYYSLTMPTLPSGITATVTSHYGDGRTAATTAATTSGGNLVYSGMGLDKGDVVSVRFHNTTNANITISSFNATFTASGIVHTTSVNPEVLADFGTRKALNPDHQLYSVGLSLSGDISLDIYACFDTVNLANSGFFPTYGVLVFPNDGSVTDFTYSETYAITASTVVGNYRKYTYANVAAKEMADGFVVVPYRKISGVYYYGLARTVSVQNYAEGLYALHDGLTSEQSVASRRLAAAMMNYGAEAQKYFDYNAGSLANASLKAADKAIDTTRSFTNHIAATGTATLSGVDFRLASLVLEELPLFKFCIETESISGLTFQMATNASFSDAVSYKLNATVTPNYYAVETRGILPAEMDTPFYFRVKDGSGNVTKTLVYSASTYAARTLANESAETQAAANVIYAMFNYCDAVTAYAAAYNSESVVTLPALSFMQALRAGTLQNGTVYRTSENLVFTELDSDQTYNANGAVLMTPAVNFNGASNVTLKNLTIRTASETNTALSIANGDSIVLEDIVFDGVCGTPLSAQTVDGLMLKDIEVSSTCCQNGVVLSAGASEVYLSGSTLTCALLDATANGLYATGNDLAAVSVSSDGAQFRSNDMTALTSSSLTNALFYDNDFTSVTVTGADNAVFLKNRGTTLDVQSAKHLYVVSNAVATLTLRNDNYVLADENTATTVNQSGNQNTNGTNLTDVNARLESGADEDLLPHVDKEQFTYAERKATVRKADGTYTAFCDYVRSLWSAQNEAVVAPGVYTTSAFLNLSQYTGKTLYAYGVMMERGTDLGNALRLSESKNCSVIGLTISYALQSNGQVYVVGKSGSRTLTVIPAAGMMNEFGYTNTDYYNTHKMTIYRAGSLAGCRDSGFASVTKNANGTMTIDVETSEFNSINVGDVLACRASNGYYNVDTYGADNIRFKDLTLYGASSAFGFYEYFNQGPCYYERVCITNRPGAVIDQATYNTYRGYETTYGISFDLSVDATGNYRGSVPRMSSLDSLHVTGSAVGSQVTSCLFECMDDDGTNQSAFHARLADYADNGDGTVTVTFKGNIGAWNYGQGQRVANTFCYYFKAGDEIAIYTPSGKVFMIGTCTTAETVLPSITPASGNDLGTYGITSVEVRQVTVSGTYTAAALNGYDLSSNDPANSAKVMVDNLSHGAIGWQFDNTVIRNNRSRGLLLKAPGTLATPSCVKNCTFDTNGMSGILIDQEIEWAESGYAQYVHIENNLFKNGGFLTIAGVASNDYSYAPINITGLGTDTSSAFVFHDFVISGNKFENRRVGYAISVESASNIQITGNDYGARYGYTAANDTATPVRLNYVSGCAVYGNTKPASATEVTLTNSTGFSTSGEVSITPTSFTYLQLATKAAGDENVLPALTKAISDGNVHALPTNYAVQAGEKIIIALRRVNGTDAAEMAKLSASVSLQTASGTTNSSFSFGSANFNALVKSPGQTVTQEGTGGWSVGYVTDAGVYTPYNYENGSYIVCMQDDSVWQGGGHGGMFHTNGRYCLTSDYYTALAYTVPANGTISISIDSLLSSADTARRYGLSLAIYKDSTVIWPMATTSSSFAFASANFNALVKSPGQTVTQEGTDGWSVGYLTSAGAYTPYNYENGSYIVCMQDDSVWQGGGHGGMYHTRGCYCLTSDYATCLAYTVPKTGNVAVQLDKLESLADTTRQLGLSLAIYKNNQMVWPVAGGNSSNFFTSLDSGYTEYGTARDMLPAVAAAGALPSNLSVTAGDKIIIAMRRVNGSTAAEMANLSATIYLAGN